MLFDMVMVVLIIGCITTAIGVLLAAGWLAIAFITWLSEKN